MTTAFSIAALILGFGFIIFVHELGHFLVAKWVGIKVTQFAIGFGHSLLCWRKGIGFRAGSTEAEYERRIAAGADPATMGETEYRLNWMPLGGYVKMVGQEDMDPTAVSDDPRSFNRKPVWARACVISAGVVMNLIFAVVFFVVVFMAGVQFPAPVIGQVAPDSPASRAIAVQHPADAAYRGLQPGDKIVAIDDKPVMDMMEIGVTVALSSPNESMRVRVERDGEPHQLTYRVTPEIDQRTELLSIGVESGMSLTLVNQDAAINQTPSKAQDSMREPPPDFPRFLADAGVRPGMTITAVDDSLVRHYHEFVAAVAQKAGLPAKVTFTHEATGQTAHVAVAGQPLLSLAYRDKDVVRHLMGLVPATRVAAAIPGSPAAAAGVKEGDLIARLGWKHWPSASDIFEIVKETQGSPLALEVLREGEVIALDPVTPEKQKIGIAMDAALNHPIVSSALPGTPAAQLNLTPGSRILSINDRPVADFNDMQRVLSQLAKDRSERGNVRLGVMLNIVDHPTLIEAVVLDEETRKSLAAASWAPPMSIVAELDFMRVTVQSSDPIRAVVLGVDKTHQVMMQTYQTLLALFRGHVKAGHLRGPVGIVHIGTKVARQGWTYLLFFLGLISVNLVVINFLPIPIVDGGLMVFLIIEKLKGSPVGPRLQTAATMIGLILIGSIFLVTTYNDIARLIIPGS